MSQEQNYIYTLVHVANYFFSCLFTAWKVNWEITPLVVPVPNEFPLMLRSKINTLLSSPAADVRQAGPSTFGRTSNWDYLKTFTCTFGLRRGHIFHIFIPPGDITFNFPTCSTSLGGPGEARHTNHTPRLNNFGFINFPDRLWKEKQLQTWIDRPPITLFTPFKVLLHVVVE